jgi:hypothetical protein
LFKAPGDKKTYFTSDNEPVGVENTQKVPFVLACFQASAAPRTENPDSDEKNPLFGLDTQITIIMLMSAQKIKRVGVNYNSARILY